MEIHVREKCPNCDHGMVLHPAWRNDPSHPKAKTAKHFECDGTGYTYRWIQFNETLIDLIIDNMSGSQLTILADKLKGMSTREAVR